MMIISTTTTYIYYICNCTGWARVWLVLLYYKATHNSSLLHLVRYFHQTFFWVVSCTTNSVFPSFSISAFLFLPNIFFQVFHQEESEWERGKKYERVKKGSKMNEVWKKTTKLGSKQYTCLKTFFLTWLTSSLKKVKKRVTCSWQ